MKQKTSSMLFMGLGLLVAVLACSLPGISINLTDEPAPLPPTATSLPTITATAVHLTETPIPSPTVELPTPTMEVFHSLVPSTSVEIGKLIYDVTSVDTAAENRAPYGDSYDKNLFERPFLDDMSYVPDLDIASYNLSMDKKFYFISIELVGTNPNNDLGIQYGVELDLDADGFGDYIVIAYPPYSAVWSTENVQVVRDSDHDTGGLSGARSDAPLPGDGYEQVIFDGGRGPDDDPDLAWVRINAGAKATVQFAFKVGLVEDGRFMFGVISDGGLREIGDLDYVDRFTIEEAGSSVRDNKNYPLKALFGVDNTCRTAQGFEGNWQEPQRCPKK